MCDYRLVYLVFVVLFSTSGYSQDWELLSGKAEEREIDVDEYETVLLPSEEIAVVTSDLEASAEFEPVMYSFLLKAPALGIEDASTVVDLNGAEIAFIQDDGEAHIYVFDAAIGESGEWQKTSALFDSTSHEVYWMRIAIREYPGRGIWDLFLDGSLVAAGIGSAPLEIEEGGRVYVFGHEVEETSISGFVGWSEPHEDEELDSDFVSTFPRRSLGYRLEKVQHRFGNRLVYHDSRLMQLKAVFAEMIELLGAEFLSEKGRKLIFVDNQSGNDANTGRRPDYHKKHGPVATFSQAVELVKSKAMIVVFEGDGVYLEEHPDTPDLEVTWLFLGDGISGAVADVQSAIDKRQVSLFDKRLRVLERMGFRLPANAENSLNAESKKED